MIISKDKNESIVEIFLTYPAHSQVILVATTINRFLCILPDISHAYLSQYSCCM